MTPDQFEQILIELHDIRSFVAGIGLLLLIWYFLWVFDFMRRD